MSLEEVHEDIVSTTAMPRGQADRPINTIPQLITPSLQAELEKCRGDHHIRRSVTKDKPEEAGQKVGEELGAPDPGAGTSLSGPEGLLKKLTKPVLETELNQEMTEPCHDESMRSEAGRDVRTGARPKTMLTNTAYGVTVQARRGIGRERSSLDHVEEAGPPAEGSTRSCCRCSSKGRPPRDLGTLQEDLWPSTRRRSSCASLAK